MIKNFLAIATLFYGVEIFAAPNYCLYGEGADNGMVFGLWEKNLPVLDESFLSKPSAAAKQSLAAPIYNYYRQNQLKGGSGFDDVFRADKTRARLEKQLQSDPDTYQGFKDIHSIRSDRAVYWGGYVGFPMMVTGVDFEMEWTEFIHCRNGLECQYSNYVITDLNETGLFHNALALSADMAEKSGECRAKRWTPKGSYLTLPLLPKFVDKKNKKLYPIDLSLNFESLDKTDAVVFQRKEDGTATQYYSEGVVRGEGLLTYSNVPGYVVAYSLDEGYSFGVDVAPGEAPHDLNLFTVKASLTLYGAKFLLIEGTSEKGRHMYLVKHQGDMTSGSLVGFESIGFIESVFFRDEFWREVQATLDDKQ